MSGNCPWNTEGPPHSSGALLFLGSWSTPFSSRQHHIWAHTQGFGELCLLSLGFIALSGLWLRPGLELPALQINLVIHPGLFGFRAGRLWHQPRAAPVRLPWTKDGSTKPLGSPSCPTQGFGSCGGTAGGSLGLLRAGPGEDLGVWWLQVCSRTHPPSSQLARDWL